MADVFRRAKNYDGVDWVLFVDARLPHDLRAGVKQESHRAQNGERHNPADGMEFASLNRRDDYSCPKSSMICSSGIAPCRSKRQRPSSLVRSMMVEGMSRGDGPPSTMIDRQSPN
jgi:hypothetical protein